MPNAKKKIHRKPKHRPRNICSSAARRRPAGDSWTSVRNRQGTGRTAETHSRETCVRRRNSTFPTCGKKTPLRPIHTPAAPIPRWDKNINNGDGTKGAYVRTIQVGIDGYRQMASRYPNFGSVPKASTGRT